MARVRVPARGGRSRATPAWRRSWRRSASSTSAGRRPAGAADAASPDEVLARVRRRDRRAQGARRLRHRRRHRRPPETPNLDAMLARFSSEHRHDEDEVRFIVEGRGVFHIHPQDGPGLRDRGGARRPDPRAARHAALVRPVRRPAHPRHPPVPGPVRLDAALHRERRRPRVTSRVCLGPAYVTWPAAGARERAAGRASCSTSRARRRRSTSCTTCCSRSRGSATSRSCPSTRGRRGRGRGRRAAEEHADDDAAGGQRPPAWGGLGPRASPPTPRG